MVLKYTVRVVFSSLICWDPAGGKRALVLPWSRVLLEKLTGFQLVKKFPAFYGTLSWSRSIQSKHPHPTSWRSIL